MSSEPHILTKLGRAKRCLVYQTWERVVVPLFFSQHRERIIFFCKDSVAIDEALTLIQFLLYSGKQYH